MKIRRNLLRGNVFCCVAAASLLFSLVSCGSGPSGSVGFSSEENSSGSRLGKSQAALLTDPSFQVWSWSSGTPMFLDADQTYLADVNGDGKADLIARQGGTGVIYVSLSNGTGFSGWTWNSGGRMLWDADTMYLADVDGNGSADLVARQGGTGVIYVSLSNGAGFPGWTWNSGQSMFRDVDTMYLASITGNKGVDLIKRMPGSTQIYHALNNGKGGFSSGFTRSAQNGFVDADQMYFANVDGKLGVDLVVREMSTGKIWVAPSNGTGFDSWTVSAGRVLMDNDAMYISDVNSDGKADIVARGAPGASNAGWLYVGASKGLSGGAFAGFNFWSWNSGKRMLEDNDTIWLNSNRAVGDAILVARAAATGFLYAAWGTQSPSVGFTDWKWNSGFKALNSNDKLWLTDISGDSDPDLVAVAGPGFANDGVVYTGLAPLSGPTPATNSYTVIGLTSTSVTAQLTWNSVGGATYYKVRSQAGPSTIIDQTVSGTSAIVNLNLNLSGYSHSVAACNSGGCSDYVTIGVYGTPPSPPTGLRAVATGQAITVYWNAVSSAQNYLIQEKKPDGSISTHTGVTTTSDNWTALTPSSTYVYSVYACTNYSVPTCSVPAYITGTVGSSTPSSGLINIDLQMSGSDPVTCVNASAGFWVDGVSYGQATGSSNSVTCDITKLAAPLAIKSHWVCSQWTSFCCKCVTLTSTNYTPTITLVGTDCGYNSVSVPANCN